MKRREWIPLYITAWVVLLFLFLNAGKVLTIGYTFDHVIFRKLN